MRGQPSKWPLALATVLALCAAVVAPARAGEDEADPDDTAEHGAPFFGEARVIGGMEPLADVRVKAQLSGTMRFFIVSTDDEGRFKRSGMGPDVDPEKVEITCEKTGFRTIEVMRRRLSKAKDAGVEVECLMEKVK